MKKLTLLLCFIALFALYNPCLAEQQSKSSLIKYQQFNIYEKMYKTSPNNTEVLANYLNFVEKNGFYLKGIELSQKLYSLTHEEKYLVKQAELQEKQGNFDKALVIYKNIYKTNPKNAEITKKITYTYYNSGKFEEALPYFKQYLSLKYNPDMQLAYGKSLFYTGKNKEAKAVLENYMKKNPGNLEPLALISDVYLSLQDYDDAIRTLTVLNNSYPFSKELKIKLGDALFSAGQPVEAATVFSQVIEKDPQNVKAISSLANISLSTGNYEKASIYFVKLIYLSQNLQVKIDEKDVFTKLGISFLAGGNYDKAEEVFYALSNTYPDDSDIVSYLANTYIANKKYDKALNVLNKILEKEPNNYQISLKVARLYVQLERFAEAKVSLEQLNRKYPEKPEVIELLADVNFYTGNYQEAVGLYQKVYDENNDDLKYKFAESLRLSKDFKNAETLYKELEKTDKYGIKAQTSMAYIKLENYKVIDSRKMFAKILKEVPDNYDAQLGLGITYVSTEDYLQGLEILKKLPDNDEVNYEKGKAYYDMKMYDDAQKLLKDNKLAKAQELYKNVTNLQKLTITPTYGVTHQNGDADSEITIQKYKVEVSKEIAHNLKPKASVTVSNYNSGYKPAEEQSYHYEVGIEGRPTEKVDFDSKIGYLKFGNTGGMMTGKISGDYFVNDKLKLKAGFERYNLERSLLSSVGVIPEVGPFAGNVVGQVADNKFNVGYVYRFPKFIFNYGEFNIGSIKGENTPSNQYQEAVLGVGKVWFSRPKGHLLDLVMTEITGYYAGYDDNRLGYGGASLNYFPIGSDGMSTEPFGRNPGVGGYFSPEHVFSETAGFQLRGTLRKINTNYHLWSYAGMQNVAYNGSDFIWGSKLALVYNEEGRLGLKAIYGYEDYNQARRQNFALNLIIRPW